MECIQNNGYHELNRVLLQYDIDEWKEERRVINHALVRQFEVCNALKFL